MKRFQSVDTGIAFLNLTNTLFSVLTNANQVEVYELYTKQFINNAYTYFESMMNDKNKCTNDQFKSLKNKMLQMQNNIIAINFMSTQNNEYVVSKPQTVFIYFFSKFS